MKMNVHSLKRLVVIDDDQEMRSLLKEYFQSQGARVTEFSNAKEALQALSPGQRMGPENEEGDIDVIVSDINMPHLSGLDFTAEITKARPEIPVILITAFGSIETAVEAMKRGAFHYVVKPFKLAEMSVSVDRAIETRALRKENLILRQELSSQNRQGQVVGKSQAMKAVFDLVSRVAQANANVLITGESGTGKEMIARSIHDSGPRKNKPFVAINCTAIPETLLESELFGHAKGAFTGAIQRKKGLFEEAEGGTLFLDEIGDMDPSLQSKLLRVLQDHKVRAVGENTDREIDVRIIAATHKDLKSAMKEGRFREDLYYRLSVIPIVIPALRQRQEDIPILANYFLKKYAAINHSKCAGFTRRAMQKLIENRWDGNVRELENVVERSVVLSQDQLIDDVAIASTDTLDPEQAFLAMSHDFPTVDQLEKRYIQLVLEKTAGRKDKAAQILGMNRRTLYRKEREYGWVTEDESEG